MSLCCSAATMIYVFVFLLIFFKTVLFRYVEGREIQCPFTGSLSVDLTIEPYGIIYAEYGENLKLPCCQRFRAYVDNTWIIRSRFFLDHKKQVEKYDSRFWNPTEHWLVDSVDTSSAKAYYCKHGLSVATDNNTYVFFINVINPNRTVKEGSRDEFFNYKSKYLDKINNYLSTSDDLALRKFQSKNGIRLKAGMRWDEWSECDKCKTKTQTRYGRCELSPTIHNPNKCREGCRMFNKTAYTDCTMFWTVNETTPGLSDFVKSVPDFFLSVKCVGTCDEIQSGAYKRVNTRILELGASATLTCPTYEVTRACFWHHNGIRIAVDTYDRSKKIAVNEFCVIYLRDVTQAEKGNYSCYLDGNYTATFNVLVNDLYEEASARWRRHIIYLLYIIFLCYIILIGGIFVGAFQLNNFKKLNKDEVIEEFETSKSEYERLLPN